MTSFSQRKGLKPIKSVLQVDSMDDDLRNSLWNALDSFYWSNMTSAHLSSDKNMNLLIRRLWIQHFKYPTDTINTVWHSLLERIRKYFFAWKWNEVYDFIEFVANNYPVDSTNEAFMKACNIFLEREVSAYRFVGGQWGRMSIVDTKPFMLPVTRHSIFECMLLATSSPA